MCIVYLQHFQTAALFKLNYTHNYHEKFPKNDFFCWTEDASFIKQQFISLQSMLLSECIKKTYHCC